MTKKAVARAKTTKTKAVKTTTARPEPTRWYWRLSEALPLIIPAVLAAFGAVAILLLLLGRYRTELVIPLGLMASGAVSWVIYRYADIERPGTGKERRIAGLLAILGISAWVLVNLNYTSQNIFVYRDPAIYSVGGKWLSEHDRLQIPISPEAENQAGISPKSAGFGRSAHDESELYTQGLHLLPSFLGIGGRLGGDSLMLHLNPLFGGAALLAVYGFAAFLARPRWALLVTAALGLSLPMIYFSRDTYSEPLAAALTFGALSLLWLAQSTGRRSLWFIAGLTAGAGLLTRIDAIITLGALAAFLAILLSLAGKRDRKATLTQAAVFVLGIGITGGLGWLDVTQLSSGYYTALAPRIKQELLALAIVLVLGAIVATICWGTRVLQWLNPRTIRWRPVAAILFVLLVSVALASRPFWRESHHKKNLPLVRSLQQQEGAPVDGSRDYAENTATWIAWYIGPPIAVLGVAGMAVAAGRATTRRDLLLIPGLLVVFGTSLVFLNRPSITPDQIWASRRLLPVIMPGMAVFAALALDSVKSFRVGGRQMKNAALGATSLAVIAGPVPIAEPFLRTRTYVPQLAQMRKICDALPDNAFVLWVGEMSVIGVQSTRAYCDVQAARVLDPTQKTFKIAAAKARRYGKVPIVGINAFEANLLPKNTPVTPINNVMFQVVPSNLFNPPRRTITTGRTIALGLVQPDGTITPLTDPTNR